LKVIRTIVAGMALIVGIIVAAGFVSADKANAATSVNKQVWHANWLDPKATEIAGVPLTVMTSDSDLEWLDINEGNDGVIGFTCPACSPSAGVYNPIDGRWYSGYRTIWIAPSVDRALRDILANGLRQGMDYYQAGRALLTLDHEAQHWRLYSGDEARVNACALADLPRMLSVDFGLPAQVQQSIQVPQSYQVRVRQRVRLHGRYVYRYRWVTKTRYVWTSQSVDNPVMSGIVSGAQAFYRSQPYPYNAGTCS
jgi:hypothetical protein